MKTKMIRIYNQPKNYRHKMILAYFKNLCGTVSNRIKKKEQLV